MSFHKKNHIMKNLKLVAILFFGVFNTQSKAQSNALESLIFEAKYAYSQSVHPNKPPIMIIVNGIKLPDKGNIFDKIDANDIEVFSLLKAQDARSKYGDRAFVGVIEIKLKKDCVSKYEILLREIEVKFKKDNFLKKSFKKKLYKTTITGVIKDTANRIIPNVRITNSTKKELYFPNSIGNFKIKVAKNDSIFFYSRDFEWQKIKVNNDTTLNITLKVKTKPDKIDTATLIKAMMNMKKN